MFQYLGKEVFCGYGFRTDAGSSSTFVAFRSVYRSKLTAAWQTTSLTVDVLLLNAIIQ